jgi:hypothetical protein
MKSVLCSLCVLCGLNLTAATLSPSTVHDDIPGTATIGEVSTAAGARQVDDLGVYKIEKEPYLDDKYFPVCFEGREIPKDNLVLKDESSSGFSFTYSLYERDAYINGMGFNKDGDWLFADGWSFNGKLSPGWPKLSFRKKFTPTSDRLAIKSHVDAVANNLPQMVTNVARSVVNTVWDAKLGVAWEARMHNGQLYYVAVTNKPPEVK